MIVFAIFAHIEKSVVDMIQTTTMVTTNII